jgi:hypothetical protein
LRIEQDVLRLEIAMNPPVLVGKIQRTLLIW